MFASLGVNWAGTLLGCVGVIMIPIPIVFLRYGAKIRQRSKLAPTFSPKAEDTESDGPETANGLRDGEVGEKAV